MVSPSVFKDNEQTDKAEKKEVEVKAPAPEKPKQKEKKEVEKKDKADELKKINPTAGMVSPDAKATNSAITEPLFNADYLNNTPPVYPAEARSKGIEGKVLLNVLVSADGTAKKVTVIESSGSQVLDKAAKDAVESWNFIQAEVNKISVESSVIVPIIFNIKG